MHLEYKYDMYMLLFTVSTHSVLHSTLKKQLERFGLMVSEAYGHFSVAFNTRIAIPALGLLSAPIWTRISNFLLAGPQTPREQSCQPADGGCEKQRRRQEVKNKGTQSNVMQGKVFK